MFCSNHTRTSSFEIQPDRIPPPRHKAIRALIFVGDNVRVCPASAYKSLTTRALPASFSIAWLTG
ncbi:MAG TPA: hypothetical protein VLN44_13485, partial [Pyrinomonadaceae bacterium]|nr:hypothetical protein [Pyrinomonadaceae bacterium]